MEGHHNISETWSYTERWFKGQSQSRIYDRYIHGCVLADVACVPSMNWQIRHVGANHVVIALN